MFYNDDLNYSVKCNNYFKRERERERILKEFISLKLNYEKNKKKRRKIITKTNIDKTKTIYNIMKI